MRVVFRTASSECAVETASGELLTEPARRAGFALNTRCGGKGTCRGCVVVLENGRFRYREEDISLGNGDVREVRACQCVPLDECTVFIPGTSIIETSAKIEDSFILPDYNPHPVCRVWDVTLARTTLDSVAPDATRLRAAIADGGGPAEIELPLSAIRRLALLADAGEVPLRVVCGLFNAAWRVLHVERAEVRLPLLGVAVDIGTTTVAAALIDLGSTRILRKASRYNGQIGRADDVVSRIGYCRDGEKLKELQQLVIQQTVNPLIRELCRAEGATPADVYTIAISGNTVMTHLLLGISPEGMGSVPFRPVETDFPDCRGSALGLSCHEEAVLHVVPSIAGYVGGDITSDLLIAGLPRRDETAMLVDVGTNGEIVLSHNGELLACATAAGPAFEGHGIRHGCRAATGAIEGIAYTTGTGIELDIIGGGPPVGICGTGIIGFMATGLRSGALNRLGRFDIELMKSQNVYTLVEGKEVSVHACVIAARKASATGYPLVVTEADVAQILKAKAAIFAGMKTLLDERGLTFDDIDRFVIAGGFGRHLRIEEAIVIGLIPEIPLDKFDVIGNGSLAGACLTLLDSTSRGVCRHLAAMPRVLELNLTETFETNFIDALVMPNMEEGLFASTIAALPDWE